jgi:hypothetical protein
MGGGAKDKLKNVRDCLSPSDGPPGVTIKGIYGWPTSTSKSSRFNVRNAALR